MNTWEDTIKTKRRWFKCSDDQFPLQHDRHSETCYTKDYCCCRILDESYDLEEYMFLWRICRHAMLP